MKERQFVAFSSSEDVLIPLYNDYFRNISWNTMPVPTHGPFCQTLIYDAVCWSCQEEIFVFQCSCGSAVLFDEPNPPWPKHVCGGTGDAGGVGGSGISDWQAVDVLQAHGVSITPEIMQTIFPGRQGNQEKFARNEEIKKVEPKPNVRQSSIAIVRELLPSTRKIKDIENLPDMGIKILGLDPKRRYCQITLVDNGVHPNKSYTALVPEDLIRNLSLGMMVMAELVAYVKGSYAHWVVTDINPL